MYIYHNRCRVVITYNRIVHYVFFVCSLARHSLITLLPSAKDTFHPPTVLCGLLTVGTPQTPFDLYCPFWKPFVPLYVLLCIFFLFQISLLFLVAIIFTKNGSDWYSGISPGALTVRVCASVHKLYILYMPNILPPRYQCLFFHGAKSAVFIKIWQNSVSFFCYFPLFPLFWRVLYILL